MPTMRELELKDLDTIKRRLGDISLLASTFEDGTNWCKHCGNAIYGLHVRENPLVHPKIAMTFRHQESCPFHDILVALKELEATPGKKPDGEEESS